ncbi:MAG TPA: nicotinate (nicotinamide) nucleotide adenylyltransferase [Polyangia bacterium]|nr:nicotinate (nicotinamide) nucleotide adenylyltransferase [Polyangia bacterium]
MAIYGGSFNPPHLAHQLAITCVLATARVDEVWLVPTFKHPFDKALAPFADRARMCEIAAAPFDRGKVRVDRIEAELGGDSYTLRTIRALQERHPAHDFAVVIGADLVAERERWHGWPELSRLVPFIVVGRQGHEPVTGGLELPAISSTLVRERLGRGEPVDGMVAADVIDYVHGHGLYRDVAPVQPAVKGEGEP